MNRLVTDRGVLRGGQIVRGEGGYGTTAGQDIQYNAAGERVAVLRTEYTGGYYDYYWGYYYPGSYSESRESYVYNAAGRLYEIQQSSGAAVSGTYDPYTYAYTAPTYIPSAPVTGTVRSRFSYDTLGRQIGQTDYEANGYTVAYSRSAYFNNKSQLLSDYTSTKKSDGATYQASTSYDYGYGTAYALGSALSVSTINYKNNNNAQAPDTLTTNSYVWWDGAVQSQIAHKPNTAQATTYYTNFSYNGLGQLISAYVGDGRPRNVTFRLNAEGQIIRRDEADNSYANGDPHEVWYRFNGRQLGYTGNNGTSDVSIAASISERGQAAPTGTPGAFRNGATYGSSYADFANSYDPINSYSQGSSGGSYTVRAGDTLQGIAQQIWGDSALWYKLAEANGLSGSASLAQGTTLILPGGVIKSAYNAGTVEPYDPAKAIGDVTPSTPTPQAPKKNKCGVFGMILLAVVAIVVATLLTAGVASLATGASFSSSLTAVLGGGLAGLTGTAVGSTALGTVGAIGAGVAGAIGGSIVSQGLGIATGIQEKFSWKAVGLAAISAGFASGLNAVVPGGGWLAVGARAAASSAITQGIGVATGLQDKFSWVGVAAAGVGAAAGHAVFPHLSSIGADNSIGNYAAHFGQSAVNAIANAATRSAIEGSSFGANLVAALPDVVAQTIGDLLFNGVSGNDRSIRNYLISLGADKETAKQISREASRQGLDLAELKAIANAGGKPTPEVDVLARSYIDKIAQWDADIASGKIDYIDKNAYGIFKKQFGRALVAIDEYRDVSDPTTLLPGYYRRDDIELKLSGIDPRNLVKSEIGLHSSIYSTPDGVPLWVFRGSEMSWRDWKTNIYQNLGWKSEQYEYVAQRAKSVVDLLGGNVEFTGHSLGGGLATLGALITHRPATNLAAAPLNESTLRRYGVLDYAKSVKNIVSIAPIGEALDALSHTSFKNLVGVHEHQIPAQAKISYFGSVDTGFKIKSPIAMHSSSFILSSMFYTANISIFDKGAIENPGKFINHYLPSFIRR